MTRRKRQLRGQKRYQLSTADVEIRSTGDFEIVGDDVTDEEA